MPAGEPVCAYIFHTAPQEAEALGRALVQRLKVEQLDSGQLGPVVAAHVGPGGVCLAVCPVSATC
jgi:fatty acid-binding protein DegV